MYEFVKNNLNVYIRTILFFFFAGLLMRTWLGFKPYKSLQNSILNIINYFFLTIFLLIRLFLLVFTGYLGGLDLYNIFTGIGEILTQGIAWNHFKFNGQTLYMWLFLVVDSLIIAMIAFIVFCISFFFILSCYKVGFQEFFKVLGTMFIDLLYVLIAYLQGYTFEEYRCMILEDSPN